MKSSIVDGQKQTDRQLTERRTAHRQADVHEETLYVDVIRGQTGHVAGVEIFLK